MQTDAANNNVRYPNTIVLTISRKGLPVTSHVVIDPSPINRLRERSYVKCEQVMTISKGRLEERVGQLSEDDMRKVENALRRILVL